MDLVLLSLAKKFALKVAAGFSNVVANNEDHSIDFTLNDGSTAKLTIPVPHYVKEVSETDDEFSITIE